MAIRAMILRKKISEANKQIDALRENDFEQRRADLEKREEELKTAIEEATTDEEQNVVEDAANEFDADKAKLENDIAENERAIADAVASVEEMQRELESIETEQRRTVPPMPEQPTEAKKTKSTGGKKKMFKCRSIRQMSVVEREEFATRDDVKTMLAEIRAAIAEKRALIGGAYTIPDVIAGLLREDVIEYSKLYKHCRVLTISGNAREIVMGTSPEAFWEECCDPIYELEQSISKVELECFKVAGFIPLCNALVEDSDIDLIDEIMVSILQAIGLALDKAILYGTGVKMPTGVVTAINADETVKLTNLVKIASADSVGVKLFQSLVRAGGLTANAYARGAKVWAMNEGTYTTLQAEALSVNASGAIVTGVNGSMPVAGGVIEVLNFVPDKNIVAGYFDLYVLGERKGFTIDTSEHVRFIQDQTVVRGRARYDGKPAVVKAFVAIGIDNTDPSVSIDFANPSQG